LNALNLPDAAKKIGQNRSCGGRALWSFL